MSSVLGSGVFNSDGDMWKFHRSMTRPFFTRDRISDFDLFDRHATTVFTLIKERMRSGHAIDFQDLMSRFTLDSASEFLFGHCVHSLSASIPYPHNATYVPPDSSTVQAKRANAFASAFLQSQEIIASRERYGWIWPLTEIFEDKTKKPMEIVRAYLDPIIQEAIEKNSANAATKPVADEKGEAHLGEGETLIDHLVRLSSGTCISILQTTNLSANVDPVVLRDETLNIMIAGRDTTASSLTFVIYCLAMYPAVHVRLREEVLAKVGPTRRPDYDDIRDMKYLRAVINAEEFDPDRFLDDRVKKYLVKNSFIFLPFNAGPRICLGQQFAYNEISFMLIRFMQQFTKVTLDEASTPADAKPPAHWTEGVGRRTIERVYPKSALTMYAQVRDFVLQYFDLQLEDSTSLR
ncbi:hypothetical protein H0H93_013137 [Arthromyces matolae]|nr:hypothetical protein H0H93_013137 [Arthromyces matolae]